MNKFTIIIILFFASLGAQGQDSTATEQKLPGLYYLFQNNYSMAVQYNDPQAAKTALYSMINMDPMNDSLRFTLAYMYYEAELYPSVILTCMDIISLNPQHAGAIEMTAIAFEQLGIRDKALANYEKLFIVTENIQTLYKLSCLQYELERYGECEVNLDILLANPGLDQQSVIFPISETEEKEYVMKVAVLNLSGLNKKAQGDIDGAREEFNKALAIAPDFLLAKDNLAELDK